MIRVFGRVALLTSVYALALASFDPVDLLVGAILSVVMFATFSGMHAHTRKHVTPGTNPNIIRRTIAFFPWSWAVLKDVVYGTWQVLVIVLGFRPAKDAGVVSIPIGDRSQTGVAVSGMATTLSPGTVLIDVDWDKEVMIVHAIDASDPDKVREALQQMYDNYQRFVFP